MYDTTRIVEINDSCYLDTESHMLTIQIDRITFTLYVEEFLDFFLQIGQVSDFLKDSEMYIVGKTMDESEKDVLVPKPQEDEYN